MSWTMLAPRSKQRGGSRGLFTGATISATEPREKRAQIVQIIVRDGPFWWAPQNHVDVMLGEGENKGILRVVPNMTGRFRLARICVPAKKTNLAMLTLPTFAGVSPHKHLIEAVKFEYTNSRVDIMLPAWATGVTGNELYTLLPEADAQPDVTQTSGMPFYNDTDGDAENDLVDTPTQKDGYVFKSKARTTLPPLPSEQKQLDVKPVDVKPISSSKAQPPVRKIDRALEHMLDDRDTGVPRKKARPVVSDKKKIKPPKYDMAKTGPFNPSGAPNPMDVQQEHDR